MQVLGVEELVLYKFEMIGAIIGAKFHKRHYCPLRRVSIV